ncbi:MAG TPA: zinc metalloprotease HtpX [Deltaproteobacteria bacterium]|nr:zinc metalloprotease HtpX [Deltaproteobacteria bacterium]HOM29759.1 zinc metalloprotease HtpX [Deltaproteobacteria bacterium]HPP81362.1 zinc metalloprotease HtpX [Deltaproteobacteria bacterium]
MNRRVSLFFQTLVIMAAMACLFGLLGWVIFGRGGLVWSVMLALVIFLGTPRISPWVVLRMYRARRLEPVEAQGLYSIVQGLAKRAGLPAAPVLYYVPSGAMNAFSVGTPRASAIALSDGLLRTLSWREIAGVLAHEVSHIKNNDLRIHALADLMTRVTSTLSFIGQVLIVFYLPMAVFSDARVPLAPILLLIFAPTVSMLLQLALSRTREFDADLGAAELTGDPGGLASALRKMESLERRFWPYVFFPARKGLQPSLLRTHPHTEERIRRLDAAAAGKGGSPFVYEGPDLHSPSVYLRLVRPKRRLWPWWG